MGISTTDLRPLFTKDLIDVYKEKIRPTAFLRSFFKTKESWTKEVSIEVMRGTEKVAVDVERGTEGNRNTISKTTEKVYVPPYFREYKDITELALYDKVWGNTDISAGVYGAFLDSVAEEVGLLQDKIERAYELQASQALQTGIVTLNAGINIDFKRKAASILDLGTINSNRYWSDSTNSTPHDDLETAGNFLRQVGKAEGGNFNVIMGSSVLNIFLSNTKVSGRADIRNFSLDAINAPQRNSEGATLHGEVSAGSYNFRIWAYPQFYDNASNVSTPYIDPTKLIVLPENPRFVLSFASVPQLIKPGAAPKKGAFLVEEFMDERQKAHIMDVQSAGIAVPVAVDQIYTLKALA